MRRMWFGLEIDMVGLPPLAQRNPGISWNPILIGELFLEKLIVILILWYKYIIFSVVTPKQGKNG